MIVKIDLSQIASYERELEAQQEVLAKAKRMIEFNRLMLKQTKAKTRAAKHDVTLKAFITAMPLDSVEVMPGPDAIYASVTLGAVVAATYRDVPEKLGLSLVEQRHVDNSLGSPILRIYRHNGTMYYVTEQIR